MPLPRLEDVEPLLGPFELLDMVGNTDRSFTVVKYELGRMTITPRVSKVPKDIVTLRAYVKPEDKPLYPDYWDVTAQTLIPQLLSWLEKAGGREVRFTIHKYGEGPSARFSVRTGAIGSK